MEDFETDVEEQEEYNLLRTRHTEYQRIQFENERVQSSSGSSSKTKVSNRSTQILVCEEHSVNDKPWSWSKESSECGNCINFNRYPGQFSQGKLPTQEQVVGHTISLIENDEGHSTPIYQRVATDLCLHWIYCNVYTQSVHKVAKKVKTLYDSYKSLKKNPVKKRGRTFWGNYSKLISNCKTLFDIKASDERRKQQEMIWGVKMVEEDHIFYRNQCLVPQVGCCSTFISRKWSDTNKRKIEMEERHMKQVKRKEEYERSMVPITDFDEIDEYEEDKMVTDIYFDSTEKCKYSYNPYVDEEVDDMPYRYQHIRTGLRSVRPEYYTLIHQLTSKYHMSKRQAQGAVVEVGNILFGRNWKAYSREEVVDCNTLPAQENINRTEPYVEAMILAAIVEEMMQSEDSVIVYSNDGSSMNKVGSYVVQSFSIDGKQRALPTLPVFTENKETLKDLEVTTLKMLSASTGCKYSEKEILEKVDFVMTDSTAHNIGVIEDVCEELDVTGDDVPKSLVCNVHPLMMMQRVMKTLFSEIHDVLGNAKIKDCFMVDVDFTNESFIVKAVKCLSSFINKDCSAKPWNRESHFNAFIAPKKNFSLILKDHRFNRLFDCCTTLLYHLDDIKLYLEKYTSILNNIAIIDRSFLEMTMFKPIFCAAAIIGFHVARPFLNLVLEPATIHDTLRIAFPTLYDELSSIDSKKLMQVEQQVLKFVSSSVFKLCMPEQCSIKDAIMECIDEYENEVKQLIDILLPRLASGFSHQRGSLYGFGPEAKDDTGTLLKICNVDSEEERMKLNKAPIHNLSEERGVGFINYELDIRGKGNLKSASTKMILNKSFDLISKNDDMKKYVKPAKIIKEMKLSWNEKMKKCEEAGMDEKEASNLTKEKTKLELLQFLRNQEIPGPFTTEEEVKSFMQQPESKEKNKRLYNEVRYARITSLALKPTASVFRLKRDHKKLDSFEYGENLVSYFGTVQTCTTLTKNDLNNVLRGLLFEQTQKDSESSSKNDELESGGNKFKIGSHVAAIWIDETSKDVEWYLGVIESISGDGKIMVSYLERVDEVGMEWVYPAETDLWDTKEEQIIMKDIIVNYACTLRIRVRLTSRQQLNVLTELLNGQQ